MVSSRPSRTRGLKHDIVGVPVQVEVVASFTDAWIETSSSIRGVRSAGVASFTDAWIETLEAEARQAHVPVASFTDAWIET